MAAYGVAVLQRHTSGLTILHNGVTLNFSDYKITDLIFSRLNRKAWEPPIKTMAALSDHDHSPLRTSFIMLELPSFSRSALCLSRISSFSACVNGDNESVG